MKILHVIRNLDVGGAEILLKQLVILFKKKGHDVSVMTVLPDSCSYIAEVLLQNGINIIRCPAKTQNSIVDAVKNLVFLVDHFRRCHYDVVHTHLTLDLYNLALVNFLLRRKLKLITTEHNTVFTRRDKAIIKLFQLEKFVYSFYSQVICITDIVQDYLVKKLPFLEKKCTVIDNGIDLTEFSNCYDPYLKLNIPVILCIGSLCQRKDQATLIRAVGLVKGLKLWLVGDGPSKTEFERLIKELNLEDVVILFGERCDIAYLLNQATIYVQPSLYEGFGIAILEAMCSGVPIISSNGPGMAKLVDGVGEFFPVGDTKALSELITHLLKHPEMLLNMSKKGMIKAQQYSILKTADEYLKLYSTVIRYD